jgi:hypothetical protein
VRDVRFPAHDSQTVRERGLWRFAIDEPSNDLVDEGEAEPNRELAA